MTDNNDPWIVCSPEFTKLLEKEKRKKRMKCCKDECFVNVSSYRIVSDLNDHIIVADKYDMTEEFKLKKSKIKSITFNVHGETLIEMSENYIEKKGLEVE